MGRYSSKDECSSEAKENQKLMIGCSYTHGLESYNWIVGFSDKHNNLVYVPEGTKLIGPDSIEYELRLEKVERDYSFPRVAFKASLHGKEKRFNLETEVKISLDHAMMLRFDKKRAKFRVKQLGGDNQEADSKKSKTLLGKLKEKFCA